MLEKDMQVLLAQFPDDFFPSQGFKLEGYEQSLRGVGRFDLLFQDQRSRFWLLELKAVPLKIADTDQVLRYFEELCEKNPNDVFIPCFVAPDIPRPVRLFLDRQGIEYKEIHEAEFTRVAKDRGFELGRPVKTPTSPDVQRRERIGNAQVSRKSSVIVGWPTEVPRPTFDGHEITVSHRETWLRISTSLLLHTGKLTRMAHNECYQSYLGQGKQNALRTHVNRFLVAICGLPVVFDEASGTARLTVAPQSQLPVINALGSIADPLLEMNA